MARIAIIALMLLAAVPAARRAGATGGAAAGIGVTGAISAGRPAVGSCRSTAAIGRAGGADRRGPAGRPHASAVGRGPAQLRVPDDRIRGAVAHGLPLEFFARVIWQESRFRPGVVGPVTRSGDRAPGIAQFMPRTAAERGLLDPFDPVQALPKSAEFLRELRAEFGNLGLAAAAYNAGPQRLRDYLAGRGGMPAETRTYVAAITGMTVDEWARSGKPRPASRTRRRLRHPDGAARPRAHPFVEELERRVEQVAASAWGVTAQRRLLARPCARGLRPLARPLSRR